MRRYQIELIALCVCIPGLVAGSRTATAEEVRTRAVADAFVAAAVPDKNFGGGGALSLSAPDLPKGEFQSVIRFDSASIKSELDGVFGEGGWRVSAVALGLTATKPVNSIFNASAAGQFAVEWLANDEWPEGTGRPGNPSEDGVTFDTLPNYQDPDDTELGEFAFDGATEGYAAYSLGPAKSLSQDLTGGGLISFRVYAADDAVSYTFNSRNFTNEAFRPELIVTAVEVPEPAGFLAIALAGTIAVRVWRRG